ncbi:hypothetical protein BDA99DRAFT_294122 [Phascolomyces articulosus]|uniref:Uncharacterized protein n=1 Tax=Phascolomyces articulosus TaxID=60185 RepID=A0AAD5JLN1_9FUNG|nr:hypothetical protein BDA99DRAFT_294122 [Phascolomyces articulosus]
MPLHWVKLRRRPYHHPTSLLPYLHHLQTPNLLPCLLHHHHHHHHLLVVVLLLRLVVLLLDHLLLLRSLLLKHRRFHRHRHRHRRFAQLQLVCWQGREEEGEEQRIQQEHVQPQLCGVSQQGVVPLEQLGAQQPVLHRLRRYFHRRHRLHRSMHARHVPIPPFGKQCEPGIALQFRPVTEETYHLPKDGQHQVRIAYLSGGKSMRKKKKEEHRNWWKWWGEQCSNRHAKQQRGPIDLDARHQ